MYLTPAISNPIIIDKFRTQGTHVDLTTQNEDDRSHGHSRILSEYLLLRNR